MADTIAFAEHAPAKLSGALRCILLAGGLKPTPLAAGSGMPALRLFPDGEKSILDNWITRLGEMKSWLSDAEAPVELRILFDHSRDALEAPSERGGLSLIFESESAAYRGPAGVVRDVAVRFADDATVLIAEANRWLASSLLPMLRTHLERNSDVTVARQPDGSPSGVYLARKAALDLVNNKGFIDLKEQWLSTLSRAGLDVFVHTFEGLGSIPIRTREDCLRLARRLRHTVTNSVDFEECAVLAPKNITPAERWCVIAPTAEVHPSAQIIGSVVMPMAKIGAGAVVARSIVAPGAVVPEGGEIVDQIVRGDAMVASKISARAWENDG